MSGTSADGVDAALVELTGAGLQTGYRVLGFAFTPYPQELREKVLEVSDPQRGRVHDICRLHAVLGEWFARAALAVCRDAGVSLSSVDVIGSHGQTVQHLPGPSKGFGTVVRSTLQIGSLSVVAERTGVTTVGDFRARDTAAGGQGAPLVPLVDFLLFRSSGLGRAMLNVGGIANVTVLPGGCGLEDVFAFDTGPGNMVMDAVVSHVTGGAQQYDRGGALARQGTVSSTVLQNLMQHPYFACPPPKSTGREAFGKPFVDELLALGAGLNGPDLVRTAMECSVRAVGDSLSRWVLPQCSLDQVVVSGGGARNPALMAALDAALPGMEVVTSDALGMSADAKEAIAFAVLANETVAGNAGNLPQVTGASHPCVLGVVAPGPGRRISFD